MLLVPVVVLATAGMHLASIMRTDAHAVAELRAELTLLAQRVERQDFFTFLLQEARANEMTAAHAEPPPINCSRRAFRRIDYTYKARARTPTFNETGWIQAKGAACLGDIAEHLPVLRRMCADPDTRSCTEIGVRRAFATYAFVSAAMARLRDAPAGAPPPPTIQLHDMVIHPEVRELVAFLHAECPALDIQWVEGDDLTTPIAPADVVLLDTWHTYKQLRQELRLVASGAIRVRRALALHDTFSFAGHDEKLPGRNKVPVDEQLYDGVEPDKGLRPAVDRFLGENRGAWRMLDDRENCAGLAILAPTTPGAIGGEALEWA